MSREENEKHVRSVFNRLAAANTTLVSSLVEDAEEIVSEAKAIFEGMIPNMAYVDHRDKPMAIAVFICSAHLALFLALSKRGVDAHDYGREMLNSLRLNPPAEQNSDDGLSAEEQFQNLIAGGENSQENALPGEFVYEAFTGAGEEFDWGMNVKSCAICHAFSQHDAMDLVPYMCATDDVMSDLGKQGLRREGSIALGASHCDFRYRKEGEPNRLAENYPQRIKVSAT